MNETDSVYRERLYHTIYAKQQLIDALNKISDLLYDNSGEKVRFRIETKHWNGYSCGIKKRSVIDIDYKTMLSIVDIAIAKEREYINKLIDMEVNLRIEEKNAEKVEE